MTKTSIRHRVNNPKAWWGPRFDFIRVVNEESSGGEDSPTFDSTNVTMDSTQFTMDNN